MPQSHVLPTFFRWSTFFESFLVGVLLVEVDIRFSFTGLDFPLLWVTYCFLQFHTIKHNTTTNFVTLLITTASACLIVNMLLSHQSAKILTHSNTASKDSKGTSSKVNNSLHGIEWIVPPSTNLMATFSSSAVHVCVCVCVRKREYYDSI